VQAAVEDHDQHSHQWFDRTATRAIVGLRPGEKGRRNGGRYDASSSASCGQFLRAGVWAVLGLLDSLGLSGVRTVPGSSTTHEPGLLGPALAAFIITGLNEGRSGVTAFAKRFVLVSRPTSRFLIYSLSPLSFSRSPS
jgi:hypothetical protein